MIHVFIVDDHKMVIDGMQLLLKDEQDIVVVGTALNGEDGIKQIPGTKADVILLDINMPGINGIETCKELLKINPDLKIIAISMHKESSLIKLMLSNGAKGYVLKNAGQDEVIDAIKTVYEGKMYLDDTVNEIVLNSVANNGSEKSVNPFPKLSRREKDVLNLILEEYTTQEIADKLFISFGTVETHRRNMLIKTGARNTAGLVRIALEYELVKS
jgi:DNA-binding NarL/FixJ family response regulator